MSSNLSVLTHDITGRRVRITAPGCSLRIRDPQSPYTWRWIGAVLAAGQELDASIWYENLLVELAWVDRGERPWEFIDQAALDVIHPDESRSGEPNTLLLDAGD